MANVSRIRHVGRSILNELQKAKLLLTTNESSAARRKRGKGVKRGFGLFEFLFRQQRDPAYGRYDSWWLLTNFISRPRSHHHPAELADAE